MSIKMLNLCLKWSYGFVILFWVILSGCGSHTKVDVHEMPIEQVRHLCGGRDACTEWDDRQYEVLCDIFIAPPEFYSQFGDRCYEDVMRHERNHCYEQKSEIPVTLCGGRYS